MAPRMGGMWAVWVALALGASPAGRGNPVPEVMLFTHVQPSGGEFCSDLPIQTCDQIVQATPLTGVLDFDLIVHWLWPGTWLEDADSLAVSVRWPFEWSFMRAEACGAGGRFEQIGSGGRLRLPTLLGAATGTDQLGLARVTLYAPSYGRFDITSVTGYSMEHAAALAGRVCGTCLPHDTCSHHMYETPFMTQDRLDLEAATGDSIGGILTFESACDCTNSEVSITTDTPWLTLAVDYSDGLYGPRATIATTAHAEGLAPGVYEGWVEGYRPHCSECARVIFTVTDDTPAAQPETWGHLKSRFRVAGDEKR